MHGPLPLFSCPAQAVCAGGGWKGQYIKPREQDIYVSVLRIIFGTSALRYISNIDYRDIFAQPFVIPWRHLKTDISKY